MAKLVVLLVLGLVVTGMGWVRLAQDDPARWHEDPRLVKRPSSPKAHLVRLVGGDAMPRVYQMPPDALAQTVHDVALADGATLLAGRVADRHMTFVSRSRIMGWPDYTSVLIEPAGEGAMLLGFARARYGHSDLGVNRARLERWQDQVQAPQVSGP
jgi:hypothetical protein